MPGFERLLEELFVATRTIWRLRRAICVIVLTLGLAAGLCGATTAIVLALYLNPDEVDRPEQLFEVVRPVQEGARAWVRLDFADYLSLRDERAGLDGVVAIAPDTAALFGGRRIVGAPVSSNFFHVLGVAPAIQSVAIAREDGRPGQAVVVLSHSGWKRHFGGDPGVVGLTVSIGGRLVTIAAVMPAGVRGLRLVPPDYWELLDDGVIADAATDLGEVSIVGRVSPAVSRESLIEALRAWADRNDAQAGRRPRGTAVGLRHADGSLSLEWDREWLPAIVAAFSGVLLLLAVACGNIVNLLMADGVGRLREVTIRMALGESRVRIAARNVVEGSLIACGVAVFAFFVTVGILHLASIAVALTVPPELADYLQVVPVEVNSYVALVVAACSFLVVPLFLVRSILQLVRFEPRLLSVRAVGSPRVLGVGRGLLIGSQAGASVLLLMIAAVCVQGTLRAGSEAAALMASNALVVQVPTETHRSTMLAVIQEEALVDFVAASSPGVLGQFDAVTIETAGDVGPSGSEGTRGRRPVAYQSVSADYFRAIGLAMKSGRTFNGAERSAGARVTVLSEALSLSLWPNGDAVGRTVRLGAVAGLPIASGASGGLTEGMYTVVGVVQDLETGQGPFALAAPSLYLPTDAAAEGTTLVVVARREPTALRQLLLGRLADVDPRMAGIWMVRSRAGLQYYPIRTALWTTLAGACLALLLTIVGVVAVASFVVRQRRHEFAIRTALGATAASQRWLVAGQYLPYLVVGALIGNVGAASALGVLPSTSVGYLLVHLLPADSTPLYVAATGLVIGTALVAVHLAARFGSDEDLPALLRE